MKSNKIKSVTLIELIISIIIISMMILSFYSLQIFSSGQVIDSDRRGKVQNNLSLVLEHMSKYIQQAIGDINNPPIEIIGNGFRVRVDFNNPKTPSALTDDAWVRYSLATNTLSVACSPASRCGTFASEQLSDKILTGFSSSITPTDPPNGFSVYVDALGNFIDIVLVGRYDPTKTTTTSFVNPLVEMRTKIICNSSSSN